MKTIAKVYKVENTKTKGINIVITEDAIEKKLKEYFNEAGKGKVSEFHEAIRTYGEDSFIYSQIDECIYNQRFIIEEYWTKRLIEEGKELYDIDSDFKLPAAVRQFVKERNESANERPLIKNKKERPFDFREKEGKGNNSGEKNPMYGKKGKDALNGRRVVAVNENGDVQMVFNSVGETLLGLS